MNVNAKLYFELCTKLYEDNKFDQYELFLNKTSEFYLEQENEESYLLFHSKFIIKIEAEIIFDNIENDSGTWTREFNVYDVTKSYRPEAKLIPNTDINKIIEQLSMNNLLGKI